MRNRALKRYNDKKISQRRHAMAMSWGWEERVGYFVKGKTHCSCEMCQTKTRKNKSTNGRWGKNWKHSDKKKLLNNE